MSTPLPFRTEHERRNYSRLRLVDELLSKNMRKKRPKKGEMLKKVGCNWCLKNGRKFQKKTFRHSCHIDYRRCQNQRLHSLAAINSALIGQKSVRFSNLPTGNSTLPLV